jgi:predicted MPP superfamily phosphohydrolase
LQEWIWPATGLVVLVVALGVIGKAYFGRKRLRVNRITVKFPGLPEAFSGKRIVWFSDVHLGAFYNIQDLRTLVRLVNEQEPDIIGFGGDFLDNRNSLRLLGGTKAELKKLEAPMGKFAILGNHDYKASAHLVTEALTDGGFSVLINRTAVVSIGSERLYILGLDDVLKGRPKLARETRNIPNGAPAILLVHEPDPSSSRGKPTFALQLSGHSHGGQVRLPFIGPIITTKYGKTYAMGFYPTAKGGSIYTSPGVGTTLLPFRLFCRPEIAVITLESAETPSKEGNM